MYINIHIVYYIHVYSIFKIIVFYADCPDIITESRFLPFYKIIFFLMVFAIFILS